jgi:leucyl/phenylalanyl-tRNA--protein transferase
MYDWLPKLDASLHFPDVEEATPEGVLAIGGDLSPERLLLAYQSGIFPWYDKDEPILWWAPPYRMVVAPEFYKPHKSVLQIMRKGIFEITWNQAFEQVIENCKTSKRKEQEGTWITDDIINAYTELHRRGYAKSVEVWQDGELVGGLYGIDLRGVFCGESMFSLVNNASKVAFVWLIKKLKKENYVLLDCQVYNEHLERLGSFEMYREDFMDILDLYAQV